MICEVELIIMFDHMIGQIAQGKSEWNVELLVLFALEVFNTYFLFVEFGFLQFPEVLSYEYEVLELEGVDPYIRECETVVEL